MNRPPPLPSLPPGSPVEMISMPPGSTVVSAAPHPPMALLIVDRLAELAAVVVFGVWVSIGKMDPATGAGCIVLLLARTTRGGAAPALGKPGLLGTALAALSGRKGDT